MSPNFEPAHMARAPTFIGTHALVVDDIRETAFCAFCQVLSMWHPTSGDVEASDVYGVTEE